MPRIRKPGRNPDLESNTAPDLIDKKPGRELPEARQPDSIDEPARPRGEAPAPDGVTRAADGGNPQHPVHDEDGEDMGPEDFEREIDSFDGPVDEFDAEDETVH
jgi:hypothetical protein